VLARVMVPAEALGRGAVTDCDQRVRLQKRQSLSRATCGFHNGWSECYRCLDVLIGPPAPLVRNRR
jgi:hypothetical protein